MSPWRLVAKSIWHFRLISLAVMAAVAVATLVLAGALIIGDSVRGSLRQLVLERLGSTDLALVTERFFSPSMAQQLIETEPELSIQRGIILPQVTIEAQGTPHRRRDVFLSAWLERGSFAQLTEALGVDEIIVNQPLADDLRVSVGDRLIVRLPEITAVPADSALGRKDGRGQSRGGLKIKAILPASGPGEFTLALNQQAPRNAFVALDTLQQALGVEDRLNAVLVGSNSSRILNDEDGRRLAMLLAPELADFGLNVERVDGVYQNGGEQRVSWSVYQFTSDRMIWDETTHKALLDALNDYRPIEVFTYLANTIKIHAADRPDSPAAEIPYSTITALDMAGLAMLEDEAGNPLSQLQDDEIALNSWAAHDLGARIGDEIEVFYFDPETTHGQTVERSQKFRLSAIVPIVEPITEFRRNRPARFDQPPSRANDPGLTPTVQGVTDQDTIDDWDPPFPFDSQRVRRVDDDYWSKYRTTPKAFMTLAAGRKLWFSRFGQLTGLRFMPPDGLPGSTSDIPFQGDPDVTIQQFENAALTVLRAHRDELGIAFQPVKQQGLTAATGTTSFAALFLGFSFFLIAAALMLIAILIRLNLQLRAREIGLTQAVGWTHATIRNQLLREVSLVALSGAAIGALGAIGFAALMLWLLRNWWVRAITVPFVELYVVPSSVLGGAVLAVVLACLVAWWTIRTVRSIPLTHLLRGRVEVSAANPARTGSTALLGMLSLSVAIGMALFGMQQTGMQRAGLFFGSGAALLVGLLLFLRAQMVTAVLAGRDRRIPVARNIVTTLTGFAARAVARHPGRSTLTMGLVSAATFLIIAIAAFRLQPTASGTGGFDWLGRMDRPIFVDLNDPQLRTRELGAQFTETKAIFSSLRVRPGDDASCRNLYRVAQPQILGVTPSFIAASRQGPDAFAWAAVEAAPTRVARPVGEQADAWDLLQAPSADEPIPVVIDLNTAVYSLHLRGRIGEEFSLPHDPTLRFRIVGLLANTILQGSLLIGEAAFEQQFPDIAGYRMLLVRLNADAEPALQEALERRFADEGLELRKTLQELDDLLAIQNTYLTTFQSLGALGLLLGTLGVALVQLRSVIERRGELALLSALGFSRRRVILLVLGETAILMLVGLVIGILSAMVAIWPHLLRGQAALPWFAMSVMLASIAVCGFLASLLAIRAVQHLPVLATLRRDA